MRTKLAAAAVIGALAVAGGAVLVPAVASAQSGGEGPAGRLAAVLQELVSNGTLDQRQADAVTERLAAELPPPGRMGGHMGGRSGGHMGLGAGPEAIAEALGVTVQELHEARHDGKTLAEIAAAEGISKATLVDRLVAAATARLDEAVTDERLTAEQAEQRKATLEERMTQLVDREPRQAGRGQGFGPGHGPGQGFGQGFGHGPMSPAQPDE